LSPAGSLVRTLTDAYARLVLEIGASRMSISDLRAADAHYWADFAANPPPEPAGGWYDWERGVAGLAAPGVRVLLVGCGSGRDLVQLLRAGCIVTALEPSAAALTLARSRLSAAGLRATLRQEYFEESGIDGPFDLMWLSWHVYSYIPWSRRRVAAMRRARGQLAPGARVVLSAIRRPPQSRVTQLSSKIFPCVRADWRLEPGDVLTRPDGHYHYEHRFGAGALERELEAAGLRIVSSSNDGEVVVAERR
jgi:SAM-dependent methyltransferase